MKLYETHIYEIFVNTIKKDGFFLTVFIENELMSADSIVFPTNRYEKNRLRAIRLQRMCVHDTDTLISIHLYFYLE